MRRRGRGSRRSRFAMSFDVGEIVGKEAERESEQNRGGRKVVGDDRSSAPRRLSRPSLPPGVGESAEEGTTAYGQPPPRGEKTLRRPRSCLHPNEPGPARLARVHRIAGPEDDTQPSH